LTYSLRVNGNEYAVSVPEQTPLLWVLREELSLTGTKFGCGMAACGACTVLLDGLAVRSCVTPIGSVGDAVITTIEGLSDTGDHPVQRAWIAEQVPQCGYCQSGMILATVNLLNGLAANKEPLTEAKLRDDLTNLCRCGTYDRIRKAVFQAARKMGIATEETGERQ
jgi:isoquinoline 1-oxidoreductase subunit alpha